MWKMNKQDLNFWDAWYESHKAQIEADFFTFLSFPTISTDPNYRPALLKAASWLQSYLQKIGMDVEIWQTEGHPVIYATSLKAGKDAPTVLFYHHYDVQPVDPLDKWRSDPFKPTKVGNEVYARGASDNKGQCFYSITALKAFLEQEQAPKVNIKLFIEGEEECGSVGSTEILKKKRKELAADYLFVVDGGISAPAQPSITLGLRGIITLEVILRNSRIDLHSGIHGGIVLNPNRALVQLLAKLWDDEGKIAIDGFYDNISVPTKEELKEIDQSVNEDVLKTNFGIQAFQGEGGFSLWASNAIRPTLEINGLSGGYSGEGFKTVIPSVAKAKISCRIVPDQTPEEVLEQIATFLKKNVPKGLSIEVKKDHGGKPVRTSPHTKAAKMAALAYEEVFGKKCQMAFCGASVPIVADLTEASKSESVVIGVGLSEDDIHAPNEHFGMDRFKQGFLVMCCILRRI